MITEKEKEIVNLLEGFIEELNKCKNKAQYTEVFYKVAHDLTERDKINAKCKTCEWFVDGKCTKGAAAYCSVVDESQFIMHDKES